MKDTEFDGFNRKFLELVVNDSRIIQIDHSRVLGPLNIDGDLLLPEASRKILNEYSLIVPENRDYFQAFDMFQNILQQLVLMYGQLMPNSIIKTVDWSTPESKLYEKLVGINFTKDDFTNFHYYTINGDYNKRTLSVKSETPNLDSAIFILFQQWNHNTDYHVLISPGKPNEFERQPGSSGLIQHFLGHLREKRGVVYVPVNEWTPPGHKKHIYSPHSESLQATFFGSEQQ